MAFRNSPHFVRDNLHWYWLYTGDRAIGISFHLEMALPPDDALTLGWLPILGTSVEKTFLRISLVEGWRWVSCPEGFRQVIKARSFLNPQIGGPSIAS